MNDLLMAPPAENC